MFHFSFCRPWFVKSRMRIGGLRSKISPILRDGRFEKMGDDRILCASHTNVKQREIFVCLILFSLYLSNFNHKYAESSFQIHCFNVVLDNLLTQVRTRFEDSKLITAIFNFLWNVEIEKSDATPVAPQLAHFMPPYARKLPDREVPNDFNFPSI